MGRVRVEGPGKSEDSERGREEGEVRTEVDIEG